jgi:hypothetical protein
MMDDLARLTIADARDALRRGDTTAAELTEACLSRIDAAQALNAFVHSTADQARDQAAQADVRIKAGDAPDLCGIPLGIKDLFCTKGTPSQAASAILKGFRPEYESTVTAKLWDAGAVMLGKLNMDEFAMGSSNETSIYGDVINPWRRAGSDAALTPGGSSGGSAAAVAADLCLAATGTDTGGSIRQPAAFTGITGLKPTYGRCSRWGIIAFASSLDQAGPMTKTVRDAAIMLQAMAEGADLSSLRIAVSAGETLPAPVYDDWLRATGKPMLDGIGATEMLHIFLSNRLDDHRPACTGKPVGGYEARVVDDTGAPAPPGTMGRLAVRGPTGCRYLNDTRQANYVQDGWNITGDTFVMDEDGYFHFAARNDDIILSAGYNIAGPEVEAALLAHAAVAECAVISAPDPERGAVVEAHVVLSDGQTPGPDMARALQEHVKATLAPFKYPRSVVFADSLPKTPTGKIQRFRIQSKGLE